MTDVIITFKTTDEIKEKLKQIANRNDMSVSAVIRKAIEKYIQEEEKNELCNVFRIE